MKTKRSSSRRATVAAAAVAVVAFGVLPFAAGCRDNRLPQLAVPRNDEQSSLPRWYPERPWSAKDGDTRIYIEGKIVFDTDKATIRQGTSEKVLSVPKYDFNWQLTYYLAKPMHLLKGTKIEVIAEFDNSANNKFNPDPTKEVHWGEQTFQEMMMGYFSVVVDADKVPAGQRRRSAAAASGTALE